MRTLHKRHSPEAGVSCLIPQVRSTFCIFNSDFAFGFRCRYGLECVIEVLRVAVIGAGGVSADSRAAHCSAIALRCDAQLSRMRSSLYVLLVSTCCWKAGEMYTERCLELGIIKPMGDDKKKTGTPDRNLISFKEKYEFDYAVKQLQKQVPDTTKTEAKTALTEAAKKVSPSEGREKIMRAARKILRS